MNPDFERDPAPDPSSEEFTAPHSPMGALPQSEERASGVTDHEDFGAPGPAPQRSGSQRVEPFDTLNRVNEFLGELGDDVGPLVADLNRPPGDHPKVLTGDFVVSRSEADKLLPTATPASPDADRDTSEPPISDPTRDTAAAQETPQDRDRRESRTLLAGLLSTFGAEADRKLEPVGSRIGEHLLRLWQAGELRPGQRVPAEHEIAGVLRLSASEDCYPKDAMEYLATHRAVTKVDKGEGYYLFRAPPGWENGQPPELSDGYVVSADSTTAQQNLRDIRGRLDAHRGRYQRHSDATASEITEAVYDGVEAETLTTGYGFPQHNVLVGALRDRSMTAVPEALTELAKNGALRPSALGFQLSELPAGLREKLAVGQDPASLWRGHAQHALIETIGALGDNGCQIGAEATPVRDREQFSYAVAGTVAGRRLPWKHPLPLAETAAPIVHMTADEIREGYALLESAGVVARDADAGPYPTFHVTDIEPGEALSSVDARLPSSRWSTEELRQRITYAAGVVLPDQLEADVAATLAVHGTQQQFSGLPWRTRDDVGRFTFTVLQAIATRGLRQLPPDAVTGMLVSKPSVAAAVYAKGREQGWWHSQEGHDVVSDRLTTQAALAEAAGLRQTATSKRKLPSWSRW